MTPWDGWGERLARSISYCSVNGCERRVRSNSFCNPHYCKWRRYGDPLFVKRKPKPSACLVDGCVKPVASRGWCKTHYSQWWKRGDPLYRVKLPLPEVCAVEDCNREPRAKGWCASHYKRWRRWGDPLGGKPAQPEVCTVDGCGRSARGGSRGWCNMHYERWRKHGDPNVIKPRRGKTKQPRTTPETITCSRCGRELPSAEFRTRKDRPTLKTYHCRQCDNDRVAAYSEANRGEIATRARQKYWSNPDEYRARARAWAKNNPEKVRIVQNRRRLAELAATTVNFTAEQLQMRVAYYGHKCWICRIAPYEHLDHVKPLSRGGAHMLSNLRPTCATCNLRKSAKWPFDPSDILEVA